MTESDNGLLRVLDRLLRGQLTSPEALRSGGPALPTVRIATGAVLLGACYGAMMGLYATLVRGPVGAWQILSSAFKVPLLFLCTLLVTLPSLYVFSALARARLGLRETLGLLVAAIGVNLALLASFAPITAFFTFSTDSYAFMIALNVFFFAVAGLVALRFLWRALAVAIEVEAASTPGLIESALRRYDSQGA